MHSNQLTSLSETTQQVESPEITDGMDYDPEMWEEYVSVMSEVLLSPRVIKKEKEETLEKAKEFLFSRTKLIPIVAAPTGDGENYRDVMTEQYVKFMQASNLTTIDMEVIMRCIVYSGDTCAKRQTAVPIVIAWEKLKEAGIVPREKSISTFMYILGTDDSHLATLGEVAEFHDILFEPNEKTITLRIKSLIQSNDVEGAQKILSATYEGANANLKKLRTYLPIMDYYCSKGDASAILRLYREMKSSSSVHFDAHTYTLIIGSLAKYNFFATDSEAIDGAKDAGFSVTHGPVLLDEIVSEMADDLLEISEASAKQMIQGFLEGFSVSEGSAANESGDIQQLVLGGESSMVKLGRVEINKESAICPSSGVKLRLFALDEPQRVHVHDTLLEMARIQYKEYTHKKRPKHEDEEQGYVQLKTFSDWLDSREGEPFTAIVDGPNIAYYGHADPQYIQVKKVVDELKKMGENPLVTMPAKYTARSIRLARGPTKFLTDEDVDILENLREEERIYVVPARCLDDYYWMLGSVSNQTLARELNGMEDYVDTDGERLPGLRPLLITNDQMRDHKLDLLTPREFRRWCSCHIVNYDISDHRSQESVSNSGVEFFPADFFSREIQSNMQGESGNVVWHFPVTEWDEPSRLCLWIEREGK